MHNGTRVVGSAAVAGVFAQAAGAFSPMKWGLLAMIVLLVVDFRYTRRYKRKSTGKALPFCVALKLFADKLVDYMCYLILLAVLAMVFDGAVNPDAVRWAGMGILFTVEAATILHKWLQLYHPDIDIDVFAWLGEKWAVFRHVKRKDGKVYETDENGEPGGHLPPRPGDTGRGEG